MRTHTIDVLPTWHIFIVTVNKKIFKILMRVDPLALIGRFQKKMELTELLCHDTSSSTQ